jgi:tetratricopeptide (TPR) repeat protein
MSQRPNRLDPLIDQFFKALKQLRFDQAERVLTEMRAMIPEYNHYALWSTYLSGVVEQEQNRDWAKAERIFQQVLAADPPKTLCADVYLSLGIAYENQARWTESIDASTKGASIWEELQRPINKTMLLRQIAIACYRGFEAGDLPIFYR